ncbi:hypothetical protein Tco_0767665 [Tanacetum coccineum]
MPPVPIANKRKRRFVGFVDDDVADGGKRWPVRKFSDEFDRVATKKGEMMGVSSRVCKEKGAIAFWAGLNLARHRFKESVMKAVVRFGRARNDLNEDMLKVEDELASAVLAFIKDNMHT